MTHNPVGFDVPWPHTFFFKAKGKLEHPVFHDSVPVNGERLSPKHPVLVQWGNLVQQWLRI